MTEAANPVLAEAWRGGLLERSHRGAAAVCRPTGEVVWAAGDIARVHLPRSASKMLQALPMVESGAADAAGLDDRHLALACGSHGGAAVHTGLVRAWLASLGLGEGALRCGAHLPLDAEARAEMRATGARPGQIHHQCSGKHTGFLTLAARLGGGAEYHAPHHPVQRAVAEATAELCDETPEGPAVDGCSAPNFAVSIRGLATAMARFAAPEPALSGARAAACARLAAAMAAHPVLIGRAGSDATRLTAASMGGAAAKTGAEGGFVAILPSLGLGVALKIDDGNDAAAAAAMAALLARLGVLDPSHPAYAAAAEPALRTTRGAICGALRPAAALTEQPASPARSRRAPPR